MSDNINIIQKQFNAKGVLQVAPIFNPDAWVGDFADRAFQYNCLSYAADLNDEEAKRFKNELMPIYNLYLKLYLLGLRPVRDNDISNLEKGQTPIIGRLTNNPGESGEVVDYHWYRLNRDGSWSHKMGWHAKPETLKAIWKQGSKTPTFQSGYEARYPYAIGVWARAKCHSRVKRPSQKERDVIRQSTVYNRIKRHILDQIPHQASSYKVASRVASYQR